MTQAWRHFRYARVLTWHDGDTCEVEVDSGFGASHRVAIRVFGVSAPEVSGVETQLGMMAREGARAVAPPDSACQLWTWKQSFNRYVGRVVLGDGADVAAILTSRGLTRAWDGKTARPVFEQYPVPHVAAERAEYERLLARDFQDPAGALARELS